jgi:hypothetical protein
MAFLPGQPAQVEELWRMLLSVLPLLLLLQFPLRSQRSAQSHHTTQRMQQQQT